MTFRFRCKNCSHVDSDDVYKTLALRRDEHIYDGDCKQAAPQAFIECDSDPPPHLFTATCPRCDWTFSHVDSNAIDHVRVAHARGHWAEDDVLGVNNTRYPSISYWGTEPPFFTASNRKNEPVPSPKKDEQSCLLEMAAPFGCTIFACQDEIE